MRSSSPGNRHRAVGRTTALVLSLAAAVAAAGCGAKGSTPAGPGGMNGAGTGGGVAGGGAPGSGGAVPSGDAGASGAGGGAASGGTTGPGGSSALGGASGAGGDGSDTGGRAPGGGAAGGAGGAVSTGGGGSVGGAGLGGAPASGGAGGGSVDPMLATFSFFVTSLPAMVALSGKAEGFGGDLRFGKADGLSGADEICRQVAERGLPGAGQKQWRALLSANSGPAGVPVYARDRIGPGPWYDRRGRMLAPNLTGLFRDRPEGDGGLSADLTNENGDSSRSVGPEGIGIGTFQINSVLTGADPTGRLLVVHGDGTGDTCNDWTSTTASGLIAVGSSWGGSWFYGGIVRSCAAGVERGLVSGRESVASQGGYGGLYCFALP